MDAEDLRVARAKLGEARRSVSRGGYREARDLLREVIELDYPLTPDALNEKAEALLKRIERAHGLRVARRVLTATTLLVVAALAMLVALRRSSALVAVEVDADRTLIGLAELTCVGPVALAALDLSGMQDIHLGSASVEMASEFDALTDEPVAWRSIPVRGDSLVLQGEDLLWSTNLRARYLRLEDLTLSGGSRLILEQPEGRTGAVKLTVASGHADGTIDVPEGLDLSGNACTLSDGHSVWDVDGLPLRVRVHSGQISFTSRNGTPLGLSLTLLDGGGGDNGLLLGSNIPVDSLDFTKPVGERVESSIAGSSLVYLPELRGKEIDLSPGEMLQMDRLSDFWIRRLSVGRGVTLVAYGRAGLLKSGSPPFLTNQIPSYLEWIMASHTVGLFLGALVPVLSVILAMLYRLKILDEG